MKLTANLLNGLAAGTFLAGLIAPLIAGKPVEALWTFMIALAGIALHLTGRLLLFDLKPEQ